MPIPILMPALSPTMEVGKLAKWHVKPGETVSAGDILAEIETDKATMEVEAVDEGRIGQILINEGTDDVPVNTPIAVILEEDETEASLEGYDAGGSVAQAAAADTGAASKTQNTLPTTQHVAPDAVVQVNGAASGSEKRVFATPLARRIAEQKNIDLSAITGSGPNGRIIKQDVENAKMAPVATSGQGTVVAGIAAMSDKEILANFEPGSYDIVPHDGMRRIIAERLTQAKSTIPHFYLTLDCELDALLEARKRLNDTSPKEGDRAFRLSVNDFIIKAMALALQKVPDANATWTSEGTLKHRTSDVAVAVAVEGGLFTPIIRDAQRKSMSDISREMKDLAQRARSKKLAPQEYQGGTTAISNLGMMGIKKFDAVINPPHASIIAIGAGEKRAVGKDGALAVATVMTVTLSCDHRVIDGALGAQLLQAFKGYIEEPVTMLV